MGFCLHALPTDSLAAQATIGPSSSEPAYIQSRQHTSTKIPEKQKNKPTLDWALQLTGGIQALGFAPFPANPNGAFGAELALKTKSIYQLRLGGELGFYSQAELQNAVTLDVPLVNRFTSPWGIYGDLELVLGGELSWVNTPSYRADDDGLLTEKAAPLLPHARVGVGAAVGLDLSQVTTLPLRFFVRYRQYGLVPYMQKNEVPFMGLASLSFGVAMEMGSWNR